jgi:hypothetical protein
VRASHRSILPLVEGADLGGDQFGGMEGGHVGAGASLKVLRDRVGLSAGEVNVVADGAGLRIEPIAGDDLEDKEGRLVIPRSGAAIDDELVQALRDADQR